MQSIGLKAALLQENPLQIVGTINAYTALLAKRAGFRAIYLSGAGVANASLGLPDLGFTNLHDVACDVDRITNICDLPLLVDIDTGWGHAFQIARAIKTLIRAGAAGIHIEDQVDAKRCGHLPHKTLVDDSTMRDRIKTACDAKTDNQFTIMARTDALQVEGLEKAIDRILQYIDAGADMIFFEGANTLAQYQAVTRVSSVPVLANITEFGLTPLFTKEALHEAGIQLILYPLSVFRAMSQTAQSVYETIRTKGTQTSCVPEMQTRDALYEVLHYYDYE
ncbi:MAG: methylisocitrate lyase [Gammaproteobacteria bacterium RIFCSPHIGHO2_12_FULL_42_10]|nr:MAG: methylisocitrate lyase [Gammaproteobacteria bacterium RIFCSPHIGHO2_12_FULL_42_10]